MPETIDSFKQYKKKVKDSAGKLDKGVWCSLEDRAFFVFIDFFGQTF